VLLYATLLGLVDAGRRRLDREDGATAVEYGLMVALIAVGVIAAVVALRDQLAAVFDEVTAALG
jgi:pilus assembly protein Flp/PilA